MRRKITVEDHSSQSRWMVSYADFITLLFAFFVVMYSVSQVNETKYRALTETIQKTFSTEPSSQPPSSATYETGLVDILSFQSSLTESFKESIEHNDVALKGSEDWIDVEFKSEILFDVGQASLTPKAREVFKQFAQTIKTYDNEIQVIGHTDDIPISNSQFESNWQLSSARAVSVVRYLAEQGIYPEQLAAVGVGEFRPVAGNDTEQGRAQNRRVVIRILNQKADVPALSAVDALARGVSEESQNFVELTPSPVASPLLPFNPIQLEGGGLLFTNDPDLPRLDPPKN